MEIVYCLQKKKKPAWKFQRLDEKAANLKNNESRAAQCLIIFFFFCFSVYKPVNHLSVYEVYIQLLGVPFLPGMDVKSSIAFHNLTDHMMHLVRPRSVINRL